MTFSDRPWVASTRYNPRMIGTPRWRHGRFRLPLDAPEFRDTGPMDWPTVVFPREPVAITQAGTDPVVAEANTVMVYNAQAVYTREAISLRGDRCEWFSVCPGDAIEVARALGIGGDDPRALFAFTHTPCDPTLYRDQRLISDSFEDHVSEQADPLALDEAMLSLFERALAPGRTAAQRRSSAASAPTRRAHRDLAEDAKYVLASRYAERLTLDAIADELDCSPFHLARTFRHWTGQTIHRALTHLRIAAAMDLMEGDDTLANIALRTGFCRHSHLTAAFTRATGMSPSSWRKARGRPISRP